MFRCLFRLFAALLTVFASAPAFATAGITDYTDLWSPTNNAPYSVTMSHQGSVIVFSIYAYDDAHNPRWYLAVANKTGATSFAGDLLDFRGTPLTSGQSGSAPTNSKVGTVSVNFTSPTTANMTLTINGTQVSSTLARFALQTEQLSGDYLGVSVGIFSGCGDDGPSNNVAVFSVSHSGSNLSVGQFLPDGSVCTFSSGNYTQSGHLGQASGSFQCDGGSSGSFTVSELQITSLGFMGRVRQNFGGGCTWTGKVGGLSDD